MAGARTRQAATIGAVFLGAALLPQQAEAQARPNIRWIAAHSSNYTAQSSRTIRRIVIHTIEGSEDAGISWFRNPSANVSAHYVVAYSGRITQMLRDSDRGWHAGVSSVNADSIGIENEGYAGRNNWTNAQYAALADLVRYLTARYGIPVDRQHIIAHSDVRSGKVDPGRYFDWTRFLNMVRGSNSGTTSTQPNVNPGTPGAGGRGVVEVAASTLNVRSSAWGTVLGQVWSGQRFVVTGRSGDWLEIDWGGRSAWLHGAYVRGAYNTAVEISTSVLNVRSGPGTGYGKIGVVYQGQAYTIAGRDGDWVLIQFDRRRGYVAGWYTRELR